LVAKFNRLLEKSPFSPEQRETVDKNRTLQQTFEVCAKAGTEKAAAERPTKKASEMNAVTEDLLPDSLPIPLRVRSGSQRPHLECPFLGLEQTPTGNDGMSANSQKRTSGESLEPAFLSWAATIETIIRTN
jgi:hypothetical protein